MVSEWCFEPSLSHLDEWRLSSHSGNRTDIQYETDGLQTTSAMQRSPYGRGRIKTLASRSHCDNIQLLCFLFEMPPAMASLQGWSHRGQNKHIYWHFRTWDIFRPGTLFIVFSFSDPGVDVLFGQLLVGLVMFDKRVSNRFGEPVSLLWAQWSLRGRSGSSSHGRDNQTGHSCKRQQEVIRQ